MVVASAVRNRRRLKGLLVERGITQTDLAERLNKSRQYVNAIVNGRTDIPKDVAELMAFKTGIPLKDINGDGYPLPPACFKPNVKSRP